MTARARFIFSMAALRAAPFPGMTDARTANSQFRSLERSLWLMIDGGQTEATPAELLARLPNLKRTLSPLMSARQRGVSPFGGVSEADQAAGLFERHFAVGPVLAKRLASVGCRSVEDVLERDRADSQLEADRLTSLTAAQRFGFQYRLDIAAFIHRSECETWERLLKKVIADVDPRFSGELLGSYARGEAVSSDLDLVLRHEAYVTDPDPTLSSSLLSSVVVELGKRDLWHVTLAKSVSD